MTDHQVLKLLAHREILRGLPCGICPFKLAGGFKCERLEGCLDWQAQLREFANAPTKIEAPEARQG